jgi:hypothetical protein
MTSLLSKFQTIRICNSENCYLLFKGAHHPIKIFPLIQNNYVLVTLGGLKLHYPEAELHPTAHSAFIVVS